MTIGKLSEESGVPASTIRYWEQIGVLAKPARVNRQRRYGPDAPDLLAVLRMAQDCGFRLPEMRQLMHGFRPGTPASARWQQMARVKKLELEQQVARLQQMQKLLDRVLQCRCTDLRECGHRRPASSIL